ncbi:MAG TPA: hypothetical protein DCZ97_07010 [Syntrophus sp. (in: bacteria)]|nr:hypothetical protein [Syntrophus sp. (in: bacteria)]
MIPDNIRLLSLPPYSPELNPVEHIWDDLREKERRRSVRHRQRSMKWLRAASKLIRIS